MPAQWIDFRTIKDRADFERVLKHYNVTLHGNGDQRSALCVFHKETKPSLKINLGKKLYNCFGCGAGGNVLDFVARLEGVALRDAARKVAEICGFEPTQEIDNAKLKEATIKRAEAEKKGEPPPPAEVAISDPSKGTESAVTGEGVNPPLTFTLKLDPDHPFLDERGISASLREHFGLGHCNRGYLKGRIAIPIHDHLGRLVAYAGRYPAKDADIPADTEKYLLPPKFVKTAVLFNWSRVRGLFTPGTNVDELVIVEGYFGVIRLWEMRYWPVALMGRSIDPKQAELLRGSGVKYATLMLDGDQYGREAADKILPILARVVPTKVVELPDGLKPHTAPQEVLWQLLGKR